jgi:uncharacterized protein
MGRSVNVKQPNKIASLIRKHPAIWFFIITFAITWTLWVIAYFMPSVSELNIMASFSPAIAGMLVAACMNSTPSGASVKKRILLFAIVLAISVAITIQVWLVSSQSVLSQMAVDVATCFICAYVYSSYYHPLKGVTQVFSSLNQKGKKHIWLLIAFLIPIGYQVGGALVNLAFGVDLFGYPSLIAILLVIQAPWMFVFGGPAAEEPGWRGFATPQMQKYYSSLVVGILIGVMWTAWHLPLYVLYSQGTYSGGVPAMLFRFVWNVPFGVLFAWVYNKSGGNLLAMLLLHFSNNLFVSLFSPANLNAELAVMILFTVAVVVATKFWKAKNQLPPEQMIELQPP